MSTQHARTNIGLGMSSGRRDGAGAFTLIEMLVVLAILAILIAIIIPAINGARNAARKADARVQMTGVAQAVAVFQGEQRRLPGYFSPRQMGAASNAMRGFTTMENMMIDLLGGVTTQAANGTTILTVGPGTVAQDQVLLDVSAMGSTKQSTSGATSKSYLAFDGKRFKPQGVENGAITNRNARVATSPDDHYFIPTLVDPFGQPILAWMGDDVPSAPTANFAEIDSTTPSNFYLAQNAGFVNAVELGKNRADQRSDKTNKLGSVLCLLAAPTGMPVTPADVKGTLAALLGNASTPNPAIPTMPLSPRAPIVFHSAGLDGTYLGIKDKGARSGTLPYTPNQDPFGGALFDDLIVTGGN